MIFSQNVIHNHVYTRKVPPYYFLQATCARCVVVYHHVIQGKKKILATTARNVTDTA